MADTCTVSQISFTYGPLLSLSMIEESHPTPIPPILHRSQKFQTHRFIVPVFWVDMALFRGSPGSPDLEQHILPLSQCFPYLSKLEQYKTKPTIYLFCCFSHHWCMEACTTSKRPRCNEDAMIYSCSSNNLHVNGRCKG